MKILLPAVLVTFFIGSAYSSCVEEHDVFGAQIAQMEKTHKVMVESSGSRFFDSKEIEINFQKKYHVQLQELDSSNKYFKNFKRYNRKYIEYYQYKHMVSYIDQTRAAFLNLGYEVKTIGSSLQGRNLFAITPVKLDPNKKLIIMTGRHHGDEGSANWIIEGFVNQLLNSADFNERFQIALYPMINPDGAEAQTRYNGNRRDLNRVWSKVDSQNLDEVSFIQKDIKRFFEAKNKAVIALDMHGAVSEDFIYRVDKNFIGIDFYNIQKSFVDELGAHDTWQNRVSHISNGHPKMARIVMVKDYGLNAMTHESIKDIKKRNRSGRSKASLFVQGEAIFKSVMNLY